MTEYGPHTSNQKPTPLLSYDHVQERKASRRKIIEAVMHRRSMIYKRFLEKKRQLQADSDVL
jgi:hypothetical protein